MASNLVVEQGNAVTLDENPPPELADSFQQVQINTLSDLVEHGIVESQDTVTELLDVAKDATALALMNRRETFTPLETVPGTIRPDLRRFGNVVSAVPDISPVEVNSFWQIVRAIDPPVLSSVTPGMNLASVIPSWVPILYKYFLFNDVTVEANSTLTVTASVQKLNCHNLLIKKTGRILIQGSGVVIKAFSVKGE